MSITNDARCAPASAASLALADLRAALAQSWFWRALAWNDILQRYRGSLLGPFWLTLSSGLFIAGLGPLYARLFGLKVEEYLPYMSAGVVVWGFISSTLTECCRTFIDAGQLMRQMKLPRLTLLFHVICRNLFVFAHSVPIILVVLYLCGISITQRILWVIPGLALLCINFCWLGLLLAMISARFRDALQIVSSILMLAFFVTPVMWNPKLHKVDAWIVDANPFAAFIELVRAPLLGDEFSPHLLLLAAALAIGGSALSAFVFVRNRKNIIYWI